MDAYTQYAPNISPFLIAIVGVGTNHIDRGSFIHPYQCTVSYLTLTGANYMFKNTEGVDEMGMGDAKLLAALGCWLGLNGVPPIPNISNELFIALCLACGLWSNEMNQ